MQLLGNCFTGDPYYIEDDALLEILKMSYQEKEKGGKV